MPVELTIVETTTELDTVVTEVILESASAPGPAGVGVPAGGTTGQALVKASDADYDTEWTSVVGGGADDQTAAEVPFTPAGNIAATDVQAAIEELDAEKAPVSHSHSGSDITSGTVAEARIDAAIARDSEVAAAIAASEAGQVRDGDAAGGVLSGTYPNPGFAVDMATQAELDAHASDTTGVHGITDTSDLIVEGDPRLTDARTPTAHASSHQDGGSDEISLTGLSGIPQALQDHLDDTGDAHDASAISVADTGGNYTATDVEGVLAEIAPQLGGGIPDLQYESRSSNTILGTADKGKVIDITATITQTFEADETLGDGWWVILRNATDEGTVVVTLDPAGSETIDGLTTVRMYSGEARLIVCNGAGGNFNSTLLQGGFARFTADGTFYVPHGITQVVVHAIGGGGGGGGGRGGATSTNRQGGSGGGGGACANALLPAATLGNPGDAISISIGTGGAGGAGGSNADGSNGTTGGNTTFGSTLVIGGGGGGGKGGTSGSNDLSGGAGGGKGEAGAVGATNANSRGGGAPQWSTAINPGGKLNGTGNAGGGGAGAGNGGNADWGGAAGGNAWSNSGGDGVGGNGSIHGGAGGGAGGGCSSANVERAGGPGGAGGTFSGSTGASGGSTNGGSGENGTHRTLATAGSAGGGGGGQDSGTGGRGGDGGAGGHGGGGGGGGTTTGGDGGNGGDGECRVWYS
jgi:hypothetical protein